jgi:hypothetical protein
MLFFQPIPAGSMAASMPPSFAPKYLPKSKARVSKPLPSFYDLIRRNIGQQKLQ